MSEQELTAAKAHEILKRISEEDCQAMGFNTKYVRPDWMILTVLPVPPPPVRPSVQMNATARCDGFCSMHTLPRVPSPFFFLRSEDDLTYKLVDIIRANSSLKKQEQNGAAQHVLNEWVQMVQYHIITYMDNTLPGIPPSMQKSGKAIKSISQRLKVGKMISNDSGECC